MDDANAAEHGEVGTAAEEQCARKNEWHLAIFDERDWW